jgi:virulence-associated protein VagC
MAVFLFMPPGARKETPHLNPYVHTRVDHPTVVCPACKWAEQQLMTNRSKPGTQAKTPRERSKELLLNVLNRLQEAGQCELVQIALRPENFPTDVTVRDEGTVVVITPVSRRAKAWIENNLQAESWQWIGDAMVVERRYAAELGDAMRGEGLVVE